MPNATPAAARALLARAALGLAPRAADAHVGPLTLRPHQRHAAARLRYALRHYRVALLADDVGLGKTAVALALIRDAPDAVVVAPAALLPHWTAALRSAAITRRVLSTEALGRAAPQSPAPPRLLVVDEAHHFRNPRTQRWQRLAALAADARLLLLTATPVHNRPDDLAALFALTLGARARALDAPTLARLVVRRSAADVRPRNDQLPATGAPNTPSQVNRYAADHRPTVAPTIWTDLDDDPDVLDALRTLPPAIAPSDGSPIPDLDRYTLIRLWASSQAALRAGLRRRLARALTVADAFDAGQHPTRAAVHALTRSLATDASSLQLSLLAGGPSASAPPAAPAQLAAYVGSLRRTLAMLQNAPGDAQRVAHLRAIRNRHPASRIVAFSHSTDTVRALYTALAPDGRVAMLTAVGGRIASGPLSRADVLARFAPLGQSRPTPPDIERIDLLLTTDVLSEGLDLRDASIVVHLDLPWTPARLAQRTGRAVRPGAPASIVHVHAFRPPPAAARDLHLAAHARTKQRAAAQTVGASTLERALTPYGDTARDAPFPRTQSQPAIAQLARDRRLERWSASTTRSCAPSDPPPAARTPTRVAAVRCHTSGYLAVVALPTCLGALRLPTLVAALDGRRPTSAPATVRRALAHLARANASVAPPPARTRAARRQLARWARHQHAHDAIAPAPSVVRTANAPRAAPANARTALLARASRALHAAAPAERATLATAAGTLRHALARPLSADHESALRNADLHAPTDARWLTAAARAALASTPPGSHASTPPRATLRALVLFVE